MKNEYEKLIIEIENLENVDIITNSGGSEEDSWTDLFGDSENNG